MHRVIATIVVVDKLIIACDATSPLQSFLATTAPPRGIGWLCSSQYSYAFNIKIITEYTCTLGVTSLAR